MSLSNEECYVITNSELCWNCVVAVYFADSEEQALKYYVSEGVSEEEYERIENLTDIEFQNKFREYTVTHMDIYDIGSRD